jgi:glucan phosphoethanolaminetransferase (alkaline phosphatase superfamily)
LIIKSGVIAESSRLLAICVSIIAALVSWVMRFYVIKINRSSSQKEKLTMTKKTNKTHMVRIAFFETVGAISAGIAAGALLST